MAEWYDYGAYAYVATEIGQHFFPGEHQTLFTMLVFAVSFVLRPLGGIIWGLIGDRRGRRFSLTVTILLISAATFCMGLLPTYESVGMLAPTLLIGLRVIQGLSTGGEYGGAATFMAEYAPDKRRGFYGSFLEVGTISGFTLAVLVIAGTERVIGADAMSDWGWRVPFLVGGPLGLIGFYLRNRLEDTPVFRELAHAEGTERRATAIGRELITVYRRQLLALAGLTIALNVANYTLVAYLPTYLQMSIGLTSGQTDTLIVTGQAIMIFFLPVAGLLSDRIGRKPVWWISLIGLFILVTPMYLLMTVGFGWAVLAFAILASVYLLQLGTVSAMFPAIFPAHVRYAGFAISYNVATALFGGTAPAVNDWLIGSTQNAMAPAFYMMGAFVIGMIALRFIPETRGCSLRGRTIPGLTAPSQVDAMVPDRTI